MKTATQRRLAVWQQASLLSCLVTLLALLPGWHNAIDHMPLAPDTSLVESPFSNDSLDNAAECQWGSQHGFDQGVLPIVLVAKAFMAEVPGNAVGVPVYLLPRSSAFYPPRGPPVAMLVG